MVAFAVYILFSRKPDYFESELTAGTVIEARTLDTSVLRKYNIRLNDHPVVQFVEGRETYYYNGQNNYFHQSFNTNERVRVIFNPGMPSNASIYSFWGYWIDARELLFSITGFIILLGIAIGITGKNAAEPPTDNDTVYKMKYN